jgi:mycothiol system anti-sigma-R factor
MIDCREAVTRMWAYLEHELTPHSVGEFERHLDACQRCCGELEFSRHLRTMVADRGASPGIPDELRSRIDILLAETERPTGSSA